MMMAVMTVEERFERHVVKGDGCHLWTAGRDKNGYGLMHDPRSDKTRRAHRVMYEEYNGPVPVDMYVCHRCDNPSCVNPDHLFAGTPRENTKDMLEKGRRKRSRRDDTHHATKVPHSTRGDIRLLHSQGRSQQSIADEFGISQSLVSQICRRYGNYSLQTESILGRAR